MDKAMSGGEWWLANMNGVRARGPFPTMEAADAAADALEDETGREYDVLPASETL